MWKWIILLAASLVLPSCAGRSFDQTMDSVESILCIANALMADSREVADRTTRALSENDEAPPQRKFVCGRVEEEAPLTYTE